MTRQESVCRCCPIISQPALGKCHLLLMLSQCFSLRVNVAVSECRFNPHLNLLKWPGLIWYWRSHIICVTCYLYKTQLAHLTPKPSDTLYPAASVLITVMCLVCGASHDLLSVSQITARRRFTSWWRPDSSLSSNLTLNTPFWTSEFIRAMRWHHILVQKDIILLARLECIVYHTTSVCVTGVLKQT